MIKQERLSQNLSIEELSKLSKVSVYKIKKIETGNYDFQLKEFNRLSKYLGIKLILKKGRAQFNTPFCVYITFWKFEYSNLLAVLI